MTELETLTLLAEVDEELLALSRARDKHLARMPTAESRCDEARAALERAHAVVAEHEDRERALDRRMHAFIHRKENAERALDLGTASAASAIKQLEQCRAAIDEIETEILEVMEELEGLRAAAGAAAAALAREEVALAQIQAEVDAALPPVEARDAELRAVKEVHLAALPNDTRRRYAKFSARRFPFTRIREGACSRCFTVLGLQREADVGRGIVLTCTRCHRWVVPG